MPYFLFLFIAMPIIEIAVLLRVGDAVGWLPTLLIVIITAVIGSSMLRQQGLATLNIARARLDSGEMPAQQLIEGTLIIIGGALLLTPGFVTDTFGLLCLIPTTRRWFASRLSSRVLGGLSAQAVNLNPGGRTGASHSSSSEGSSTSRRGNGTGEIIDGDFKRIDDD